MYGYRRKGGRLHSVALKDKRHILFSLNSQLYICIVLGHGPKNFSDEECAAVTVTMTFKILTSPSLHCVNAVIDYY
jgi:hypothetical protein